MRMRLAQKIAGAALLAGVVAGCDDVLGVDNLNQPDIERVFSTPAAVEQTIGTGYQSVHNSVTDVGLFPEVLNLSLEMYSGLNNLNMGVRVAIPRTPIQNQTGAPSIFGLFSSLSRGGRLAVNALNALDALIAADQTPNDGVLGSTGNDLRTRAFAFFTIGANQGWLAMVYDSAAIVRNGMPSDEVPELSGAHEVMAAAIEMLDSAIAVASQPAAAAGFSLPSSWLSGASDQSTQAGFIRLVKSYRARFRAGVARTPAERDAVDWTKVRDDAEEGIESDFMVDAGGNTGWDISHASSLMYQDGRAWGMVSLMYYGMADTTGAYTSWLATPLDSRTPFLVRTPDLRWPSGATRAAQVANSWTEEGLGFPPDWNTKPYIAAQTQDEIAAPWGWSYYQSSRLRYIREASNTAVNAGPYPEFLKAENDLLLAEAYLRLNNLPAAVAIIDSYRTANNLPALAGAVTSATDAVPGGSACVPRVPVPTGGTRCGDVWEAMKYEKRMETAYTSFGRWWIDSRGWGDLVEATALEYPIPYQEMEARQKSPYPLGGGGASSAARGTYGF